MKTNKETIMQVIYSITSFLIPLVVAFVILVIMRLISFPFVVRVSFIGGGGGGIDDTLALIVSLLVLTVIFLLTFKWIRNIGSKFYYLVKNKYTFFIPLLLILFYFLFRFIFELVLSTNKYGDLLQVENGLLHFLHNSRELFIILNYSLPFILVLLAYTYGGYTSMKRGT